MAFERNAAGRARAAGQFGKDEGMFHSVDAYDQRLQAIHEEEMLAAMQGYDQAGQASAAQAAIARGMASQQAANYAAQGGMASRQAMMMGAGAQGDATAQATGSMQGERLAAMGQTMATQAKGTDYALAAIQAELDQKGADADANARINRARAAAAEHEAKTRRAAQQAAMQAGSAIGGSAISWANAQGDSGQQQGQQQADPWTDDDDVNQGNDPWGEGY